MKRVKSILQPVKPSSPVTEPPRALPPRPTRRQHVLPRIIGTSLGLWLLVLSALGQPSVPPPKTTTFTRALIGTNSTAAEFRSALGFVSTNISSVTNYAGNGAAITNIDGANIQAGTITTQKVDSVFYQLLTNSPTSTAFTDTYKAWVSAAGSDTTGTVGKEELPFATVSNAVRAVKVALGSSTSSLGVVVVGAATFGEYWINLQRTNLPGISLIGVSPEATMLTSTATSYLTNLGPLVVLGNDSVVANLSISNNINAGYKQAAIGWDVSRSASAGTTIIVPTNAFIHNVVGRGSSDVAYFYDSGVNSYSIWADLVDFESKWDAFILSTAALDGRVRITRSILKVNQPDDYTFPDGGSGSGRARALYVAEGFLTIENSTIIAIGGSNTVNETTALTHFGSTEGYTNVNTVISASSTGVGAVKLEDYASSPIYIGKVTPGVITTNEPFAGSFPVATSYRTAKQTLDLSSGTNIDFAGFSLATKVAITNAGTGGGGGGGGDVYLANQNNFTASNNFGGALRAQGTLTVSNVTVLDKSKWSPAGSLWMIFNNGNYTQDFGGLRIIGSYTSGHYDIYDVNGGDILVAGARPDEAGYDGGGWFMENAFVKDQIFATNGLLGGAITSTATVTASNATVLGTLTANSNNITGGISANTLTVTDNASVGSLTFTNSGNTNSLVMFNANGQLTNPAVAATSIMRKNGTAVTVGSGLSDDGTTLSATGGSSVTVGIGLGTFVGMMTNTFWETGEGIIVKDNFRGAANNPLAAGTGVAGGSAAQAAAGVTGQAGVFKVYATPTNTGGYGTYRAFGTVMPWQSNFVNDVSLAVNGYEGVEHFIGLLAPMSAAAATDRVGWLLNTNWSPNWIAACMSNSVPYYWTSSLAAADSSIVRLSVYCPNRTNAYFFTNGILATTISTNTPAGRSLTFSARVLALTAAGSSAQQNLYLDWNWFLFY